MSVLEEWKDPGLLLGVSVEGVANTVVERCDSLSPLRLIA